MAARVAGCDALRRRARAVGVTPGRPAGTEVARAGRAYLLFAAALEDLGPLAYGPDDWGTASPTLFWPRSQQWCVGTEIDLIVTLVGGDDALIDEVLALSGAEEVDSIERPRRQWTALG